jgi:transposase
VISLPAGTRIWIAARVTDLRRGFHGLSAQVQTVLEQQPLSGHVFVFRGVAATLCRCSGSMEMDYVCWPRGLNEDALCGLTRAVEPCR